MMYVKNMHRIVLFIIIISCKANLLMANEGFSISLYDSTKVDTLYYGVYPMSSIDSINWDTRSVDASRRTTYFVYDSIINKVSVSIKNYNLNDNNLDYLFILMYLNSDSSQSQSELILFDQPLLRQTDTVFIYKDRIISSNQYRSFIIYNLKDIPYINGCKSFSTIDIPVNLNYLKSINDQNAKNLSLRTIISISPNPVQSHGVVTINNPPKGNLRYIIYNNNSSDVYNKAFECISYDNYVLNVNIAHMANGVYHGVLYSENEIIAEHSFVIMK